MFKFDQRGHKNGDLCIRSARTDDKVVDTHARKAIQYARLDDHCHDSVSVCLVARELVCYVASKLPTIIRIAQLIFVLNVGFI